MLMMSCHRQRLRNRCPQHRLNLFLLVRGPAAPILASLTIRHPVKGCLPMVPINQAVQDLRLLHLKAKLPEITIAAVAAERGEEPGEEAAVSSLLLTRRSPI